MPQSLEDRFQNLHEFVTQARTNLDRNNWDYLIGGSETETTLARNRLALDAIGFRPRVLRDVSNIDCSSSLFGKELRIPVLCAPVGSLQVFDPGGGATVAEATRIFGNGMILSSVSFGLGAADQLVPVIAIEVGARLRYEFMQVLKTVFERLGHDLVLPR